MKKRDLLSIVLVVCIIAIITSCGSLPELIITPNLSNTKVVSDTNSEDPYFKSNEVLVKIGSVDDYYLATILTPSENGKDIQVLILNDNTKMWVSPDWILTTHIPAKGELFSIGDPVLVAWFSNSKAMGVDDYRRSTWTVHPVTSIDDEYKGEITAGGAGNVKVKWIRIPESTPVEMQ